MHGVAGGGGAHEHGVSVVFPAYNEEMNILQTIARALAALRELGTAFEILIVNDRSTDSTGRLADDLASANPEIRVLHNALNLGQGGSLARGFQHARHEWVIHNAMDCPFDMRDLPRLLTCCDEADIVVAARTSRAGYSAYRVLISVGHKILLRTLFPLKLSDYGFVQLYRRRVWESLRVESRSTAFFVPEALIRAHDFRYRIKEVKIVYHPRTAGEATSGKWNVIVSSLRDMLSFWWKRLLGKAYQLRNTSLREQ